MSYHTQNQNTTQNTTGTETQNTSSNLLQNHYDVGTGTGIDVVSNVTSSNSQTFSLSKKIISNQQAKDLLIDNFNEIAISEEKFDSEKIKRIYNDLFYQIPKKGKKSHTTIIEQSTDYIYPEINQNLDSNIRQLEEELLILNQDYLSGSLPQIEPQHPVYDNGLFLQAGDPIDNIPTDSTSPIFYMQQGYKRRLGISEATGVTNGYWPRLLRQVNGEDPYDSNGAYQGFKSSPNYRILTEIELNSIPDGEPINTGDDLNINPLLGIEPQYFYSEIKLELECKGIEKFFRFGPSHPNRGPLNEYQVNGENVGYWYMDTNASCTVNFKRDIDPGIDFLGAVSSRTWGAGQTVTITISRDDVFYGHTINGTSDPLDSEFYNAPASVVVESKKPQLNWANSNQGAGTLPVPIKKYKRWGENLLFPSIIKAIGAINYRMKSPQNENGIVDGGQQHILSGIIDGGANAPNQENLVGGYYERDSYFGTTMINKDCSGPLKDRCFGEIGQTRFIHNKIFNTPDKRYYRKTISKKFKYKAFGVTLGTKTVNAKVYGQPVIKVDGKLCVFLEAWTLFGLQDDNAFYNLENGSVFKMMNKHLDDRVEGYVRDSKALFNWLNTKSRQESTGNLNNPRLYFPGLKGEKLNLENTDLDEFPEIGFFGDLFGSLINIMQGLFENFLGFRYDNPFNSRNKGSNYEITSEYKDKLDMNIY